MENINMALYLNLLFFGLIGLGALIGLLRGLKKTLYSFIVKLIFYALFFISLTFMIDIIWTMDNASIGEGLSQIDSDLAGSTSLSEALPSMLESALGENFDETLENENFLAFVEAIGLFIVKIAYTVFYFTVFNIIYRIIAFIIRIIFFRTKKENKYKPKKRLAGASVGALSGVMSIFVFLILFGGMMDIVSSLLVFAQAEESTESLSYPAQTQPLNDGIIDLDPEMQAQVNDLREIVLAYENNLVVRGFYSVSFEEAETGRRVPAVLRLFDMVFSIDYDDKNIPLRNEIAIVSEVASIFIDSEFAGSGDLADVSPDDIVEAFNLLSNSGLVTSLTPLALEIAADYSDVDLDIERDDLYAIDWKGEISQLGAIVATGFTILQSADFFDEDETKFETHVFDGDDFRNLFNEISDSEMINLAAYAAMTPLLENLEGDVAAVVTLPEDLNWEDEFKAFGEVIGAIVDTEVTISDFQDDDNINILLDKFATMDLTVIIESRMMSQVMINVFSGAIEIDGFTIIVPEAVAWHDTLDSDDEIEEKGELRVILEALNELTAEAASIDFDDFDQSILLSIESDLIESLLESQVLSATLGYLIYDLGDEVEELVIPKSVLETIIDKHDDEYEVVIKDEILKMVDTVQMLNLSDLDNFGTDILADVEDEDIEDLFQSKIIHATLSKVIIDISEDDDFIIIPYMDAEGEHEIRFFDTEDELEYITADELSNVVRGLIALGLTEDITNLENFDLDLINENIDTLLDSAILHATVSKQVIDMDDDMVVVPHLAQDDETLVRVTRGSGDNTNEYIVRSELIATLDALEALGFLDVDGFDASFDLSIIEDQDVRNKVLASNILQATISDILFDMVDDDQDAILLIPTYNEAGDVIKMTVGSGETETTYISEEELDVFIDGLVALGLTENIDGFGGDFNLQDLEDDDTRERVLNSGILQATISDTLFDMDSNGGVLNIPEVDVSGDDIIIIRGSNDDESIFIKNAELDHFIKALVMLGLTDNVDAFDGGIDMTVLGEEANQDILLDSAIMHLTVTNQLLDLGSETLIIPDAVIVSLANETFIEGDEIKALLDAFDALGFTDVNNAQAVEPSMLDEATIDTLLESASMQVTISDFILSNNPLDENDLPSATMQLVVPTLYKESVDVEGTAHEQIEKTELNYLLNALVILSAGDFEGSMDANVINALADDIDDVMRSGSMHLTIDNMLKSNAFVSGSIPDLAIAGTLYGVDDVTDKDEIKAFIIAVDTLSDDDDFTNISFTLNDIQAMSESEQETIVSSKIVRNILTEEIEATLGLQPGDPGYPFDEEDFEEEDFDNFLTKEAIMDYLDQ